MPRWGVFAIGAAIIAIAAVSVAAVLHHQEVRREQAVAATRFKKLDATYFVDRATRVRLIIDSKKMNADYVAATKAGQRRHDGADALSIQELFSLAHTERVKVEAIEALQRDVEAADQRMLEAFTDVYGADALTRLRQDMADRNEARDNSLDMWWRAAQSTEDNAKADQNDENGENSSDEIARDYDDRTLNPKPRK